jgi:hypothetical protein
MATGTPALMSVFQTGGRRELKKRTPPTRIGLY